MTFGRGRFASLHIFALVFLAVSLVLRVALLIQAAPVADTSAGAMVRTFAVGLGMDMVACALVALPASLLLVLAPDRLLRTPWFRRIGLGLYALAMLVLAYDAMVEWFYWQEYATRYNLLAVEYLRYPRELLGNIWESYHVIPVSAAIVLLAAIMVAVTARRVLDSSRTTTTLRRRLRGGVVFLLLPTVAPLLLNARMDLVSSNPYSQALARNGFLSLLRAVVNRQMQYEDAFLIHDQDQVATRLRQLLATHNSRYVSQDVNDITRDITASGVERHCNVVLVVVESLSAKFLGTFGNRQGLTPRLDALAADSLVFRNLYCTGDRTIRGLEALALSLPPNPCQPAVRRRDAANLFSVEEVFKAKGYQAKFFYGGYIRFDGMNKFLARGHFQTIDRGNMTPDEISFTNAWGVCDEDLFAWAIKECDRSYGDGKPFFNMIMTLSNHVPFTHPSKIQDPNGVKSDGAVKYTDYAIGQFLDSARAKPWFANTLFVIVADHCARTLAPSDMSSQKFHIPAYIYSPGRVEPGFNDTLCSQIDLLPTVLGIMHWSYRSKFFGRDILADPPNRALIGSPEKLGLLQPGRATILEPSRQVRCYHMAADGSYTDAPADPGAVEDAVSYYQGAAWLLSHGMYNQ